MEPLFSFYVRNKTDTSTHYSSSFRRNTQKTLSVESEAQELALAHATKGNHQDRRSSWIAGTKRQKEREWRWGAEWWSQPWRRSTPQPLPEPQNPQPSWLNSSEAGAVGLLSDSILGHGRIIERVLHLSGEQLLKACAGVVFGLTRVTEGLRNFTDGRTEFKPSARRSTKGREATVTSGLHLCNPQHSHTWFCIFSNKHIYFLSWQNNVTNI